MKIKDLLSVLAGNENTDVYSFIDGKKLYMGTAQNIHAELLEREVAQVRLIPSMYLGIMIQVLGPSNA